VRDYYAQRAPEYDRIYLKPERQEDLRAIEAWLPARFTGRKVLEVACGTGYWTQFLAPVAARLVGVDASAETLAVARSRVSGLAGDTSFVVGDAYRLPATAGSFDAAFAGFWWSHVPRAQLPVFLDGLHATLASGSPVVFLDNRYVEGSSTPLAAPDDEGNTYQDRPLADGSVHRVMKNFPTPAELREVLSGRAVEIEVREWPYFWAVAYRTR
jgi:SAM-dependent methyltransferase